jgi:hypothetical protein
MPVLTEHALQVWWDVTCIYKGQQTWAIVFGETIEEAEANFKNSLPAPELAVIVAIKSIPECTGIEAMSA